MSNPNWLQTSFARWEDARACAQEKANRMRSDYGIEKMREYGKTMFRVFLLPRPENRYGFELRCEVVQPELKVTP